MLMLMEEGRGRADPMPMQHDEGPFDEKGSRKDEEEPQLAAIA